MQQLILDSVQIKITNSDGLDVFINDIDNLKYRVIRAAHSIRDFNTKFRTYHWRDRDNPIFVRLIHFDPRPLLLSRPEFPPCVRSLHIQTDALQKKHRGLAIKGWCYSDKIRNVVESLKLSQPGVEALNVDKPKANAVEADIVSLHDELDDAQELSKETKEESDLYLTTYINTYFSVHVIDYTYGLLITSLFKDFLPEEDTNHISGLLYEVYDKLKSTKFVEAEFRKSIPKISDEIQKIAVKCVAELAKNSQPPRKIDPVVAFYKMFDALLAKSLNRPAKKGKKVSFHLNLLQEKLDRIRAIFNYCKVHLDETSLQHVSTYPLLQPSYAVKAEDESEIESYVKSIEQNENLTNLFYRLFKSLEAKSPRERKYNCAIERINSANKSKELFRMAYLTLEFKAQYFRETP